MSSKTPATEGGERKGNDKNSKAPRTRDRTPNAANNQLQSYSKLEDIKVLRTGLPAAVFEEWKRGFLIVLRVLYGDLAISLTEGEYYKPKVPSYLAFSRKRSSELQAEEAEDSVPLRTASGAARQTRATRSRAVVGAVPDATDTATTQTISQPAQQPTQAAPTTSSDSMPTASGVSSSSSTLSSLDASVAARIAKMIDNEYDDLVKIARREEKAMEANQVAMHASIWGKMSRESQERIRMNRLWQRVQSNKDPLALWKAICESHAAFASGDDVYDTNQAWSFWYSLRHHENQGLPQFKAAFDAAFDEIKSRVDVNLLPDGKAQANQFIMALDPSRFADLQVTFRNKVLECPENLEDAYLMASEWVIVPRTLPAGKSLSGHAAFHIQTAAHAFVTNSKTNTKKDKKNATKDKSDKQKLDNNKSKDKKNIPKTPCRACGERHYLNECPTFQRFLSQQKAESAMISQSSEEPEDDEDANDDMLSEYAKQFKGNSVQFNLVIKDTQVGDSHQKVLAAGTMLSENTVLLDNQATKGVFGNPRLLTKIKTINASTTFSGVGGTIKTNTIGFFKPMAMWVHFADGLGFNVLSFSDVENRHEITYERREAFHVSTKKGEKFSFRKLSSGLWACEFDNMELSAVSTVKQQELMYSKRDVQAAKQARDLSKRLGYPSQHDLEAMLRSGAINNSPVSALDARRAFQIYGPEVASLKGKSKQTPPTKTVIEALPKYVITELVMHMDIMFVDSEKFLVSVTLPIGVLMATFIPDKNVSSVQSALNKQLSEYRSREFIVHTIWCDSDSSFSALKEKLQSEGIKIEQSSATQHVPTVEVRIKVIKERCRAILNTLPYLLPRSLIRYLVSFVVSRINILPSKHVRGDGVSPREAFLGRRTDYLRDCRLAFGTVIQIPTFFEPRNSMAPRTEMAIALDSTGGNNGAVRFWVIRTRKVVTRDSWPGGEIPISQTVIDMINVIAKEEGAPVLPKHIASSHEVQDIPFSVVPSNDVVRTPMQKIIGIKQSHARHDADHSGSPPAPDSEVTNESLSSIEQAALRSKGVLLPMTTKRAIAAHGSVAETAIRNELQQMVDKKVFLPMDRTSLNEKELKAVIRSHMFVTEKLHPDGTFSKLKARLVAGGNGQDRAIYDDVSSPTVGIGSVFIVAAIAAKEQRHCKVADVTGAYLNAPMGNITVLMRIDSAVSELLFQIVPAYRKYSNKDGSLIVKLTKALYGCIESAKLWYQMLSLRLKDGFGLIPNPYDPCVMNIEKNSQRLTVAIYVDDLFISSTSESLIQELMEFLRSEFQTITEQTGSKLSYLGMCFDFSSNRQESAVDVSMIGYVDDIIHSTRATPGVSTPASANLFEISPISASNSLLAKAEKKQFHTIVAKLLYLSKRARPDILTAVAFLTSRVLNPTSEDDRKLKRVLRFLAGTRSDVLTLRKDFDYPVAYCDASYGVHADFKSQTGLYITLGGGPIYAGSSKQKLVSKSSTESELIALSDSSSHIIWAKQFLSEQTGQKNLPAIIYEDNMSTISILRPESTLSQRTKHINIRYFFLKDRQQKGDVVIKHMPTDKMIADFLTKPLQGSQFTYLRSLLMNS